MRLRAKPRRGHDYYSVVTSVRSADKVREKTILYIGRIDKLTESRRLEIVKKLKELDKPELISKFHSILFSTGYEFPSPVSSLEIVDVYSYCRNLAMEVDFARESCRQGVFRRLRRVLEKGLDESCRDQ